MYDNLQDADGIGITEDNLNDKLFAPASLKTFTQNGGEQTQNDSDVVEPTLSLKEIID